MVGQECLNVPMNDVILTLLLPWFPILLGVGVGGRLLGRTRGLALGVLCALFWVVLVQASAGPAIWTNPWAVATIVSGAAAIAAIGRWAGETPGATGCLQPVLSSEHGRTSRPCHPSTADTAGPPAEEQNAPLQQLSRAIDQFDDWLEEHRNDRNAWPKFDEFVRQVCYQCCRATHVKPYRLLSEGDQLVPLREPDPLVDLESLSARRGIVGHVITTGRSYVAGDPTQGELVEELAHPGYGLQTTGCSLEPEARSRTCPPIVWCFPIRQGTCRLGVVIAGQLDVVPERNKVLLRAVEQLINQFWCTLTETLRSRTAVQIDPVSGLHTRPAFLRAGEQSLDESYSQGEPVAVAVIAMEGLRELSDSGRWEVADELIQGIADSLRRKVRTDDCLGRFDGSRFIILLRRVDSELASLIVTQIMSRVSAVCSDQARWNVTVGVRCGLAGSGIETPDLRTLVSRALVQCRRARVEDTPIASDLAPVPVPVLSREL